MHRELFAVMLLSLIVTFSSLLLTPLVLRRKESMPMWPLEPSGLNTSWRASNAQMAIAFTVEPVLTLPSTSSGNARVLTGTGRLRTLRMLFLTLFPGRCSMGYPPLWGLALPNVLGTLPMIPLMPTLWCALSCFLPQGGQQARPYQSAC